MIDGIAASVALLSRAMTADLGRAAAHLRVDGGLTRSRLLMQTQADLLQAPVEICRIADATALGVAALARLGVGAVPDLAAAVRPPQVEAVIEPSITADQAAERNAAFGSALAATLELMTPTVMHRRGGRPSGRRDHRRRCRRRRHRAHAGPVSAQLLLIDAANDVGTGTSKANTAILHTGFDAPPGSIEARLLRRGHALLHDYAGRTGIPVERTGAVLVAWNAEQLAALPRIADKARRNGYAASAPGHRPSSTGRAASRSGRARRRWRSPMRVSSARSPRRSPSRRRRSATASAAAEPRVTGVRASRGKTRASISSPCPPPHRGRAAACAGVPLRRQRGRAAQRHHRSAVRPAAFTITPRRGELIVFDKLARPLLGSILLPVPTARTKGVLVRPTVFGNVVLGPTADDIGDKSDDRLDRRGLAPSSRPGTGSCRR